MFFSLAMTRRDGVQPKQIYLSLRNQKLFGGVQRKQIKAYVNKNFSANRIGSSYCQAEINDELGRSE